MIHVVRGTQFIQTNLVPETDGEAETIGNCSEFFLWGLISDVFDCINQDRDLISKRVCQSELYATLSCIPKDQGITPWKLHESPDCLFNVVDSVRSAAYQMIRTRKDGRCASSNNDQCGYCSRDFCSDLQDIATKAISLLPGICLRCHRRQGRKFLTKSPDCKRCLRHAELGDAGYESDGGVW